MIRFGCESCGSRYRVPMRRAGRLAKCRKCEAMFPIPLPVVDTRIAGVTRENPGGKSRQDVIRACRVGELLVLRRDPQKQLDPNAVAVCTQSGEPLGYLNSELAVNVGEWLINPRLKVQVEITQIVGRGQVIGQRLVAGEKKVAGQKQGENGPLHVDIKIKPYSEFSPLSVADLTLADEVRKALEAHDIAHVQQCLQAAPPSLVDRHFLLQDVFQYASHHFEECAGMRELCEQVAWLHFNEYPILAAAFKERWSGPMPAAATFVDLADLLTEEQQFEKAIEVCEKAMALGQYDRSEGGFVGRSERIRKLRDRAANAGKPTWVSKKRIQPLARQLGKPKP